MPSWTERREQARLKGGDAKLLSLRFLSDPSMKPHGETWQRIWWSVTAAGAELSSDALKELLKDMLAAGLIEVGNSHPRHPNIRKPYHITQKGNDYLMAAAKGLPIGEAEQLQEPREWTTLISAPIEKAVAAVIRELPEFHGSNSDRIQQVSEQLAQAISASRLR